MRQQYINPRKLGELLQEVLTELEANCSVQDSIRKEKVCLIEDILRVKKASGCINAQHLNDISPENLPKTFDILYDQDINSLEVQLAGLSAELSRYMKQQLTQHNNDFWR